MSAIILYSTASGAPALEASWTQDSWGTIDVLFKSGDDVAHIQLDESQWEGPEMRTLLYYAGLVQGGSFLARARAFRDAELVKVSE